MSKRLYDIYEPLAYMFGEMKVEEERSRKIERLKGIIEKKRKQEDDK